MADGQSQNRCDDANKIVENVQNIQLAPHNTSQSNTDDTESTVREITQTDHLNKRLLGAFLSQLNEKGDNCPGAHDDSEDIGDWDNDPETTATEKQPADK